MEIMCGINSGSSNDDITESTEKLDSFAMNRQFDIVLEIIKVHTELSVGE